MDRVWIPVWGIFKKIFMMFWTMSCKSTFTEVFIYLVKPVAFYVNQGTGRLNEHKKLNMLQKKNREKINDVYRRHLHDLDPLLLGTCHKRLWTNFQVGIHWKKYNSVKIVQNVSLYRNEQIITFNKMSSLKKFSLMKPGFANRSIKIYKTWEKIPETRSYGLDLFNKICWRQFFDDWIINGKIQIMTILTASDFFYGHTLKTLTFFCCTCIKCR